MLPPPQLSHATPLTPEVYECSAGVWPPLQAGAGAHLCLLQLLQGLPEVPLQVCHLQLEPPGRQSAALRLGRRSLLLSPMLQRGLQRVQLLCLGLQLLLLADQLRLQVQEC